VGVTADRNAGAAATMPRGALPKVYDAELVESVRARYGAGRTQAEIAVDLGLTQKVVWNLMRRHGIQARVAAKRDQRGAKNARWRGDDAGYQALHLRVEAARGKPQMCSRCGTTNPAKTYEWANLTGDYRDVNDYERMCRSCHKLYDNARVGGDVDV
jgi:hypothetical protein